MIRHYIQCWRKAFVWRGRAARSEFWSFFAVNFAVVSVLTIALGAVSAIIALLALEIYGAFSSIVFIAVTVRRLHDTNRNAWWLLVYPVLPLAMITPAFLHPDATQFNAMRLAATVLTLVFYAVMALPGDKTANAYGS